jgi:hypothetical protein
MPTRPACFSWAQNFSSEGIGIRAAYGLRSPAQVCGATAANFGFVTHYSQLDGSFSARKLLWTTVRYEGKMVTSCAVPTLLRAALRILSGGVNSAMTRSWFTGCPLALLLVFSVVALPASAEWKEKVLYSFRGGATDGSTPAGGVVFDKAGDLYGADTSGGSGGCPDQGCGMVFQVSPPAQKGGAWTETSIYAFRGVNGATDGFTPAGGLIVDAKGSLYGTTAYGGNGPCVLLGTKAGCGIVYELSPPARKGGQWTYQILYNFQGGNDGYVPSGNLVFDNQGNIYGATQFGGGKGTACNIIYGGQCGTVFKLSPPKENGGEWTERVLHSFACGSDGAYPNGGLVLDSKGAIYGTTYGGGNESGECGAGGCGTVFELDPPTEKGGAWTEKHLHVFADGNDSGFPSAGVVSDKNGNLYGTTLGTLFRLAPPSKKFGSWSEGILYTFGRNASGTTYSGNTFSGTVFRLKPPSQKADKWTFAILHGFTGTSDGAQPAASLVSDKLGNLYSTTQLGGNGACTFGCGTVFEIKP